MTNWGCTYFPFEENYQDKSLRKAASINDTIKSCIRCFLLTEKGQRRGNPIGSILPTLVHKLISEDELSSYADDIKNELVTQFPGIIFYNVVLAKNIDNNISSLNVQISFSTPISEVTELVLLIQR
jgi:phage baseplate assembly protein W